MPVHLSVVRRLAVVEISEERCDRDQYYGSAANQQPLHLGIRYPFRRLVQRQFLYLSRHFCRVFESDFNLDAHGSPELLCVNLFHLAGRTCQVGARLVKAV